MNERIRLLEQQALSIVLNGNDPDSDVDKMYIPSEFTKKFAELIVRECCLQVADVRIENDFEPVGDAVLVQALAGIKQHFGVEL